MIKRWLRRLFLSALGLVLVLLVGLFLLLGTESGTRQLLLMGEQLSAGAFTVERVDGHLLDSLSLHAVLLKLPDEGRVKIGRIDLDWVPTGLWRNHLELSRLAINEVEVTPGTGKQEEPPDEPSQPFAGLELPVSLHIGEFELSDVSMVDHHGVQQLLERLSLSLKGEKDSIEVVSFTLHSPFGDLDLQGTLGLMPSIASQVEMEWLLRSPQLLAPVEGRGNLSGDFNQFTLMQRVTKPISVNIDANVKQPLMPDQLNWSSAIELNHAALHKLVDLGRTLELNGRINAEGDLNQVKASSDSSVVDGELGPLHLLITALLNGNDFNLKQLKLTTPASTQVIFTGRGALAQDDRPLSFDLRGDWRQLRWPLQESNQAAVVTLPSGSVDLIGDLDNYQLSLQSNLKGADIPPASITLNGKGDLSHFILNQLNARTLDGELTANASVNWSPNISFDAKLALVGINPGSQWPEWPGRIGLKLSAKGGIRAEKLQIDAKLDSLGGTLRSLPIEGSAAVAVNGDQLNLKRMRLRSGSAELSASAKLNRKLNAEWALLAPNLAHLMPDLSGALVVKGKVNGSPSRPKIEATLKGEEIAYQEQRLEGLDGTVAIDLEGSTPWNVDLLLSELHSGAMIFTQTRLTAVGQLEKHHIALSTATADKHDFSLEVKGGFDGERWNGALEHGSYQSPNTGDWLQADGAAALSISSAGARLDSWCWWNDETRLCTEADWSEKLGTDAKVEADALPLEWLRRYYPEDVRFTGSASLESRLRLHNGELFGTHAEFNVDNMIATLFLSDGEEQRLNSRNLNLQLDITPSALSASYEVDFLESGHILGKAALPNWRLADPANPNQPLSGTTELILQDMQLVKTLVPEVSNPKGRLDVALKLAGTLEKPIIDGDGHLSDTSMRIPTLGIGLEAIDFRLTRLPEANGLQLAGSIRSGGGQLNLDGQFALKSTSDWRVDAAVSGNRFELARIPEIHLLASPDVKLAVTPATVDIRGRLVIPEASIQITTPTASSTSASSDIVIVSDDQLSQESGMKVTTDLEVVFGDSVRLEGEGFKGRIKGSLRVNERPGKVALGTGELQILDGRYRAYGQDLTIEQGRIIFAGTPLTDPAVNLRAIRTRIATRVGVEVTGRISKPQLKLFSEEAMDDSDRLAYLVLGRPLSQTSGDEQQGLSQAALAIGLAGGETIAKEIGDNLGIEEVSIDSGSSPESSALVLGKYLSPRLYVRYAIGITEDVNTLQMRYKINKFLTLETETGLQNSADLLYTFEK